MYRDDYIAHAIYERARAWTRASFFVAKLIEAQPVYFQNGVVIESPLKNINLLICDVEPQHTEVLTYSLKTFEPGHPRDAIHGWMWVGSSIDAAKSGITLEDHTKEIQLHLNRFRRREELMRRGFARQSWRVAPLFKPDIETIARESGVSSGAVRAFFDGKSVSSEARDKILMTVGMMPEELEGKLWESGS